MLLLDEAGSLVPLERGVVCVETFLDAERNIHAETGVVLYPDASQNVWRRGTVRDALVERFHQVCVLFCSDSAGPYDVLEIVEAFVCAHCEIFLNVAGDFFQRRYFLAVSLEKASACFCESVKFCAVDNGNCSGSVC